MTDERDKRDDSPTDPDRPPRAEQEALRKKDTIDRILDGFRGIRQSPPVESAESRGRASAYYEGEAREAPEPFAPPPAEDPVLIREHAPPATTVVTRKRTPWIAVLAIGAVLVPLLTWVVFGKSDSGPTAVPSSRAPSSSSAAPAVTTEPSRVTPPLPSGSATPESSPATTDPAPSSPPPSARPPRPVDPPSRPVVAPPVTSVRPPPSETELIK